MKKILIWGGRSKARVIIAMINEIYGSSAEVVAIFDKTLTKPTFNSNIKHYSQNFNLNDICKQSTHFIICMGGEHGYARYLTAKKLEEVGLKPLSLISKYSILDKLECVGSGLQAMPGAVAHKFSVIGDQCILNTNSTIDHECIIGNGVHVMSGACVAGRVKIGNYVTIGTNATILPDLKISDGAFIGAGAVVTKNVKKNEIVTGNPAKFVKYNFHQNDLSIFKKLVKIK